MSTNTSQLQLSNNRFSSNSTQKLSESSHAVGHGEARGELHVLKNVSCWQSHPLEISLLGNGVRSRTIDSWLSDPSPPSCPTHQLEQSRGPNLNVFSGSAGDVHRFVVVPHLRERSLLYTQNRVTMPKLEVVTLLYSVRISSSCYRMDKKFVTREHNDHKLRQVLTFWSRNYFFNFSTLCI